MVKNLIVAHNFMVSHPHFLALIQTKLEYRPHEYNPTIHDIDFDFLLLIWDKYLAFAHS